MGMDLGTQTRMFLEALALGGMAGVIYDVFRIGRRAFRHSWLLVLLEDFLFFLLCILLVFRYFLENSGGEVRLFAIAGMLLGWVLYYFTVGLAVMKASGWVITAIGNVWKAILAPVRKIAELLRNIFYKAANPLILQKNRLKSRAKVLYNRAIHTAVRGGKARWPWAKRKKKRNIPPSTR